MPLRMSGEISGRRLKIGIDYLCCRSGCDEFSIRNKNGPRAERSNSAHVVTDKQVPFAPFRQLSAFFPDISSETPRRRRLKPHPRSKSPARDAPLLQNASRTYMPTAVALYRRVDKLLYFRESNDLIEFSRISRCVIPRIAPLR